MIRKILVVDDERHVVSVVQGMLERKGYEVASASDGVEALQLIKSWQPDLVMLDLVLPRMDGSTVAQRMLEEPESAGIPIIFFTGLVGADEMRRRGPAIAGRYFLAKPFDADELYAMIDMVGPSN